MFIKPPSLAELEKRLRGRGTETEDKIQVRLMLALANGWGVVGSAMEACVMLFANLSMTPLRCALCAVRLT